MLRSFRERLHAQIAEAFEAHFPDTMEDQPEILARHCAEAGLIEKSVAYWGKAGHRSATRSAMAEAAAQFQKALDQLALLPDNPELQRHELRFRSALGVALRSVKGNAAQETGHAYARARELWEQLGSPSEFLHNPHGQSRYYMYHGEIDLALGVDEDMLRLSLQRNDSAGLVLGHHSAGRDLMVAGRFALSRSHPEAVLALYDPISHRSTIDQAGGHPVLASQAILGIVQFCLGYPDQAMERNKAAIAAARQLANPTSLATNLEFSCRLLSLEGDSAALDEQSSQLIAVATEQGFPYWRALGMVYRAWATVRNGDVDEGISLLRRGSIAYRATGAEVYLSYFIALRAKASEIAGKIEDAASLLEDALQIVERTGERWFAAELNSTRASCCGGRVIPMPPRNCIVKLLALPRSKMPSSGNCAPPRALPGFGASRVSAPRRAICLRRSTAGSPKDSIRPASKRQGRCSKTWYEGAWFCYWSSLHGIAVRAVMWRQLVIGLTARFEARRRGKIALSGAALQLEPDGKGPPGPNRQNGGFNGLLTNQSQACRLVPEKSMCLLRYCGW